MAPSLKDVMLGVEARLATIPGLRTSEYARDQINPPHAIVGVPTIPRYHATMGRGKLDIELSVTILVSARLDREGQLDLADYANPTGTKSVVVAIEGDKTLGGVVDDCMVVDFRPLGLSEVGALNYYGGVFSLRVIASGV